MSKVFMICFVLLAGCTGKVSNEQFLLAVDLCKNNEGLQYVKIKGAPSYHTVVCNNSATFYITPQT